MSDEVKTKAWLQEYVDVEVEVSDVLNQISEKKIVEYYGANDLLREMSEKDIQTYVRNIWPEWFEDVSE